MLPLLCCFSCVTFPFVAFLYLITDETLECSFWSNIPSELAAAAFTMINSAASNTHAKLPRTFLIFILLRLLDSIHKLHLPRCLVSVRYLIIQTFRKNASPIPLTLSYIFLKREDVFLSILKGNPHYFSVLYIEAYEIRLFSPFFAVNSAPFEPEDYFIR